MSLTDLNNYLLSISRVNGSKYFAEDLKVRIDCNGDREVYTNILDRKDGSFIVRYKLFQSCRKNFRIIVTYFNHHLAKSPYIFTGKLIFFLNSPNFTA